MSNGLSLFERFMFEAPGDDVPPDLPADDAGIDMGGGDPPDLSADDGPPDLGMDNMGGDDFSAGGDMGPPDLGAPEGTEGAEDEFGGDFGEEEQEQEPEEEDPNTLEVDEKISAIMNQNLYNRYLSLLNTIENQLNSMKDNSDQLYTLNSESISIIPKLKKLNENIRLYLDNFFFKENYSKNLLFFNKCLNLLGLLNNIFEKNIQKGIKAMK